MPTKKKNSSKSAQHRKQCTECVRMRENGHDDPSLPKFCQKHQCPVSGAARAVCTMRKKQTETRCSFHLALPCMVERCPRECIDGSSYCDSHVCWLPGCRKRAGFGSDCCEDHKCPDPGCQLSRKRIVNERGLWLHEFCHEHGCQTAFCRAKICLGKKYCVNHGCIINGCPDQLLGGVFGGLCQTHYDAKIAKTAVEHHETQKATEKRKSEQKEAQARVEEEKLRERILAEEERKRVEGERHRQQILAEEERKRAEGEKHCQQILAEEERKRVEGEKHRQQILAEEERKQAEREKHCQQILAEEERKREKHRQQVLDEEERKRVEGEKHRQQILDEEEKRFQQFQRILAKESRGRAERRRYPPQPRHEHSPNDDEGYQSSSSTALHVNSLRRDRARMGSLNASNRVPKTKENGLYMWVGAS